MRTLSDFTSPGCGALPAEHAANGVDAATSRTREAHVPVPPPLMDAIIAVGERSSIGRVIPTICVRVRGVDCGVIPTAIDVIPTFCDHCGRLSTQWYHS